MEFSIIIPTRNRPALLKLAVESVIQQTFKSFEIIVVNDGSDPKFAGDYQALEAEYKGRLTVLHLEQSMNGHGQSYAMNMGVNLAQGKYIGLLDDDDFWIEPEHLLTAHTHLCAANADVYFTDQQAYQNLQPTGKTIWLAGLADKIRRRQSKNGSGVYQVCVADLMEHNGFAHLNTTIVSRKLYQSIKGLDENIRYECDRDFYLRIIDQAETILYNPQETSRHNIPDPKKADNMSTLVTDLEKMGFRLALLDKAILFAKHPDIAKHAQQHKAYTLKYIADTLARQRKYHPAFYYAKEALLIGFTLKWLAFCIYLFCKPFLPSSANLNN